MSYEPLHHKYRPQSFAQLVGQEAIATTLTNAIRTSRIAPAYLFTGPRGTGKTSSARILAKSLNCLNSDQPTPQPCGKCDVCQGITKGATLDVIEIDAASNTGVDNIREIIERAQFAPVQCRYKVYVIDECHMLSTQAFNALLKTLEEPPSHVVFVLATTDPQRVLPTIISRTQRFDFRRIALDAMIGHLGNIAGNENINISPPAIHLVAQFAQGGLRDAESLLDQLSLLSGEITPDRVWDLVGSVNEKDLLALYDAIASDNPEAVLDGTRNILDRGREPLIILQNMAAFYRDLLIAKTAPSRNDLVSCTEKTWQGLVTQAQKLSVNNILVGQQHLRSAEVQLKNTTVPRLWLEVTLLGLLPSASNSQATNTVNISNIPQSSPQSVPQSNYPPSSRPPTSPQIDSKDNSQSVSQQSPISAINNSVDNTHAPKNTSDSAVISSKTDSEQNNNQNSIKNNTQKNTYSIPNSAFSTSESEGSKSRDNKPGETASNEHHQDNNTAKDTQHIANSNPEESVIDAKTDNQEIQSHDHQTISSPTPQNEDLDGIWQQIIQFLPIPARSLLSQHGRLLEMGEATATVGFPPNLVKIAQGKLPEVELAFAKVRQQKIKVKFKSNQSQGKNGNHSSSKSSSNVTNNRNNLNNSNNSNNNNYPQASPPEVSKNVSQRESSDPNTTIDVTSNSLNNSHSPNNQVKSQNSVKSPTENSQNIPQKESSKSSSPPRNSPPRNQPNSVSQKSNLDSHNSNPEAQIVERSAKSLADFFKGEIVTSSSLADQLDEEIEF